MRNVPPDLQQHLKGEATTLCRCWIITTVSGDTLGFTDYDRDLMIGETKCEHLSALARSRLEETSGLAIESKDVAGALNSDSIREQDILAGRFDGAQVACYVVNWQQPEMRVLEDRYIAGEITREDNAYRMELRNRVAELDQSKGRYFTRRCQTCLGDIRCGVDLSNPFLRATGVVTDVKSNVHLVVSGLDDHETGWFQGGRLYWTSGENSGQAVEIATHRQALGECTVELWLPMPATIVPGDEFDVTAGCDKSFKTCRDKFSNQLNFRGFPHIPGNDMALGPVSTNDQLDGGPLYP